MKLVREHINEKFKEKSDPIEDMGIGEYPRKIAELRNKLRVMFDENYSKLGRPEFNEDKDAWTKIDVIQEIQEELNILFGKEKE